jgi:hypothetical protein
MTELARHTKGGPAPCQRPGPTPMGVTHPMQPQPNATARRARVDGLIRTRYTLIVCVVCSHELIHTLRQQTTCPECGASARRSFALFRDLRE